MSDQRATVFDWPVPVTLSDSKDDPGGPFASVQIGGGGVIVLWPAGGPQGSLPLTMTVVAGQELHFPVRRIGLTNTTATGIFGLVASIIRQGAGFTA